MRRCRMDVLMVSALLILPLLLFAPTRTAEARPATGLKLYVGRDLRFLPPEEDRNLTNWVHVLTGAKMNALGSSGFTPWWVAPVESTEVAWILLEAYPGIMIPDVSAVQVHFIDGNWQRIGKQTFPTGYRFFLKEAKWLPETPLGCSLLVIKVTSSGPFIVEPGPKRPAFEQGQFQRQYYALHNKKLVLVRLEDDTGRLARNSYTGGAPFKGPPVPKRSAKEWLESLKSSGPVLQLQTLVWLSGVHLPSSEPRSKDHYQESLEDSRVFEAVSNSPILSQYLDDLRSKGHRWVQDYAKLVRTIKDE